MVIAIVGWVAIETFTDESTAPSTRTAAPLAANPPAAVLPTERDVETTGRPSSTRRGPYWQRSTAVP